MSDKLKIQGGSLANKNGKIFEEILIPLFERNGYVHINKKIKLVNGKKEFLYSKEVQNNLQLNESKYFITDASYTTIYNHKGKTEFLIINNDLNKKIRLECKWQQSAGSVDEKLPYLYLNCIQAFEEKDIILVIDGKGQKPGALDWLKNKINEKWLNDQNKNIQLMDLNEFIIWFNNLNKY